MGRCPPGFPVITTPSLRPGDRLALWVRLLPGRGERAEGRYSVNFYDAERHEPVLEVPIILGDQAEGSHGR